MDSYEPRRRTTSKARERYEARRRRRAAMAVRPGDPDPDEQNQNDENQRRLRDVTPLDRLRQIDWERAWANLLLVARDVGWYIRRQPLVWYGIIALVVGFVLLNTLGNLVSGRIMPGVSVLDVGLGGKSTDEAATLLNEMWRTDFTIDLIVEGEVYDTISLDTLGVNLDSEATAQAAKNAGLSAIPFGRGIDPVISVDYLTAQNFLLDLTETINRRPQNGRYRYTDGDVFGLPGIPGRQLDTTSTLQYLTDNTIELIDRGRFELLLIEIPPEMSDPSPYIDRVREMAVQSFEVRGYDPFTNQVFTWPIETATYVDWVAAGPSSLTLREETFDQYIELMNQSLNADGSNMRYVAPVETRDQVREAISLSTAHVDVRVRYRPTTYEVQAGDTAFAISRKTGIPLLLLMDANSGRNLDILSIGDKLNLPSPDEVMPNTPVVNKRIIVDLNSQYLMAFENGQVVFEWPVSSGVAGAPTSPGTYQILSREPIAWGSSNTLCDSAGLVCGQWEMYWFMGIYEVVPGLENGFHGDVLLPNGNFLGDGLIGNPATFGCVMSPNLQAEQLYNWAELGVVVEIISDEYPPQSDLGQLAVERIRANV